MGSRFNGIPQGLPAFAWPPFDWEHVSGLIRPAFTIALLCAIESLLSAVVADGMIDDRHDSNQELMAQGAANFLSPLFGGLPVTGVIARTATNIRSGAGTPVAGMVHAGFLLAVLLVAAPLAADIPLATLAAVLAVVAVRMGEWEEFLVLRKRPRGDAAVFLATFGLTVVFDLTVAVEVGMVLAAFSFIKRVADTTQVHAMTGEEVAARHEKVGDLPRGVIQQWRQWCLHPDYLVGVLGQDVRDRYASFGVPMTVKESFDVAGLPTTYGYADCADHVAAEDAEVVARLKAAGAIVVGKTNAPEFGHTAITKNLVYGTTRSPWNLEHTPGGSSGGSAAALAGCVLPLVTASDGGGSIRIPASFVGAYGLKTSYGRIAHDMLDQWETGDTAVAGPLTKSVADAALQLDVTCGPHPLDPNSLPHPGISYVEALAEELPAGTRFGFSPDLGYGVVQSDVAAVVEDAAHAFVKAGHRLVPIAGGPPMLGAAWGMLGAYAQLGRLAQYLPQHEDKFTRAFLTGIKTGAKLTPERAGEINRLRNELNAWCADVFSRVDFLITPTVPYDPPPAKGPFPEMTEGRKQPPAGVAAFTIPFNLSWHPAATLRAGFSKKGLPVGLQIVGPRHRDHAAPFHGRHVLAGSANGSFYF